jgi:hypothetical protein
MCGASRGFYHVHFQEEYFSMLYVNPKARAARTYNEIYTESVQCRLISSLLTQPELFPTLAHFFQPDYFDDRLRPLVQKLHDHHQAYGCLPSFQHMRAELNGNKLPPLEPGSVVPQWLTDEIGRFAIYKATEITILDGIEQLQSDKTADFFAAVDTVRTIATTAADPIMWADSFDRAPLPQFMIEPWLVKDSVTCLYGQSECFKSFYLTHASLCLATGTAFGGNSVERTQVLYVCAEGQSGIAMRMSAWEQHYGVKLAKTDLAVWSEPINLMDRESVLAFISRVRAIEQANKIDFGLLVIDTVSQCIAGANDSAIEVASAACSNMILLRRELQTTVVFVHHEGKNQERGARGSGAWINNTDAAIKLTRDLSPAGEKLLRATARIERMKDAPIGLVVAFDVVVVKLDRLAGRSIDSSLVVEVNGGSLTGMTRLNEKNTARDILAVLAAGEKISIAQLAKRMGKFDTKEAKEKLIAPFPHTGIDYDVRSNSGGLIGRLRRESDSTTYGLMACAAKTDGWGEGSN